MINESTFMQLVRHASRAPSSHNTQPWKFRNLEDGIHLLPDLSRSLPVVDPDNHALFISLGCALENLMIAARQLGHSVQVDLQGEQGSCDIRVKPDTAVSPETDPLFNQIRSRQVTKGAYDERPIDPLTFQILGGIGREEGVDLHLIGKGSLADRLLPLVIEGSDLQFGNRAFVEELVSWIRFTRGEAMKTGDGIWNATMGLPGAGRTIGSFIMKHLVTPASEAKRWKKLFRQSGGFAIFTVKENNTASWIRLGQTFQRFGLEATRNGIRHAHMNMPLEEPAVRHKVAETLELTGEIPLLLLRLGYAEPAPYSFRRHIHSIIDE